MEKVEFQYHIQNLAKLTVSAKIRIGKIVVLLLDSIKYEAMGMALNQKHQCIISTGFYHVQGNGNGNADH